MISPETYQRIAGILPVLQRAGSQLVREFQQAASFARIPPGRMYSSRANRPRRSLY
jgi:hypothetical protein